MIESRSDQIPASEYARYRRRPAAKLLKFNRSLESHAAQIFILSVSAVAFRSGKIAVERKRKRNFVGEAVLCFKTGKAVQIV